MNLDKKNKTVFFVGKQKIETEAVALTVGEILQLASADSNKKMLALKSGNDHVEYEDLNHVIHLKDGLHFVLFEKSPTPVS